MSLIALGSARAATPAATLPASSPTVSTSAPEDPEQRIDALFSTWLEEKDAPRRKELESELRILLRGVGSDREDIIYEALMLGGPSSVYEIALPEAEQRVAIVPLLRLEGLDAARHASYEIVTRRLNADHFEVWTEDHGWLFNAYGRLLNEAIPPRRDGDGREWYGAFLPDGRWVTTDLSRYDRTLTFFDRNGKWLREKKGEEILRNVVEDFPSELGMIDWARSDADGTGWIVRISRSGIAWVSPSGKATALKGAEPWQRSYKRELGPRGSYLHPVVPDDEATRVMMKESPGHGFGVLYPHYSVHKLNLERDLLAWSYDVFFKDRDREQSLFSLNVYGGSRVFGFWPGSSNVWINGRNRAWSFDLTGKCLGIIAAERIADAADGKGMVFRAEDGSVVRLDMNLKPVERRRFMMEDGGDGGVGEVGILALYDDLKAGLFRVRGQVVFARY